MRTQTVQADTEKQALELCPWAAVAVEVDGPQTSWMCFESAADYETWSNQQ